MRGSLATAATVIDNRRLILVKLEANGFAGWGEAAPVPGHTTESLAEVWDSLEEGAIESLTGSTTRATGTAGAALAQAATDVEAHMVGLSLAEYLGASEQVWASAAVGMTADGVPDRKALARVAAAGYRHVKLKISPTTSPTDLAGLIAEYESITFGVDANGSLGSVPAQYFAALDDVQLAFVEQPGPPGDLGWHQRLRDAISTPVALDESAETADAVDEIIETGSADIITVKAGRFGTSRSLALARKAGSAGLAARIGGLVESGVGRAHAVALAGCSEFSVVGDIAASDLYFDNDLVSPQWRLSAGRLEPPGAPGIGVEVDEDLVAELAFWSFVAE